jgi:fucose 4-O-acetylase-like acetyltransferase
MTVFSGTEYGEVAPQALVHGEIAERDSFLDCAKGIAIILVVIGHTFQGLSADFDNLVGFRVIYSFHMPLFAFLAGAAARFWIERFDYEQGFSQAAMVSYLRIRRSAVYLLLPFVSWTVIGYFLVQTDESFGIFMLDVFKHNDRSLWFLPSIFWCNLYVSVYLAFAAAVRAIAKRTVLESYLKRLALVPIQMAFVICIWSQLRVWLPTDYGLNFVNYFHGGLFLFFALGAAGFKSFVRLEAAWMRAIPYVAFIALVPFWHRTMPHNLVPNAPGFLMINWVLKNYALIVAASGTLAVVDMVRVMTSMNVKSVNAVVTYLGSASLAIYAIHFHMLGRGPIIIGPLMLSVALYFVLSRIPGVGKVLFGKSQSK